MNGTNAESVLIVDDTQENIEILKNILNEHYLVKIAKSGRLALEIARSPTPPDLILLDVMMPEMDGYAVCKALKADPRTQHIPVIFVTVRSETDDETNGFLLGAADYITKPVSPPIVLARVKTHLALKASADFLRDKNDYLEAEVNRRVHQLDKAQDIFRQLVSGNAAMRAVVDAIAAHIGKHDYKQGLIELEAWAENLEMKDEEHG